MVTKTSLKKRICVLSVFYRDYFFPLTLSNVGELSWSWIPRDTRYPSSEREIKFRRRLLTSFTKRKIRQFYVVVEQKGQINVQKSAMHVQSFCFAYETYCLFYAFDVVASSDRKIPRPVFNVAASYTKKSEISNKL